MAKDDDSDQEVRPYKNIASILQNVHKRGPVVSSCTSGDDERDQKPPVRRFQSRGIEGWVGWKGMMILW